MQGDSIMGNSQSSNTKRHLHQAFPGWSAPTKWPAPHWHQICHSDVSEALPVSCIDTSLKHVYCGVNLLRFSLRISAYSTAGIFIAASRCVCHACNLSIFGLLYKWQCPSFHFQRLVLYQVLFLT